MNRSSFAVPKHFRKFCWFAGICLIMLAPQIVAACPGCNYVAGGSVGRGFNMSVLFMMAMPFLVAGTVGLSLAWIARTNRAVAQTSTQTIATIHPKEEAAN